jgi:hypothetical protein
VVEPDLAFCDCSDLVPTPPVGGSGAVDVTLFNSAISSTSGSTVSSVPNGYE